MIATEIETKGLSKSPINLSGSISPVIGPEIIPTPNNTNIAGNLVRQAIHWADMPNAKTLVKPIKI